MTPLELSIRIRAWSWRRQERNRAEQLLAYNTAALTASAMRGKLKAYDKEFPEKKDPVDRERKQRDFKAFSAFLKQESERKRGG